MATDRCSYNPFLVAGTQRLICVFFIAMTDTPTLNPKHQAFADAYLMTFNQTRAAIAAGYSERSARQQGSELMTYPNILAYIRKRMEENAASAIEVIHHLTEIARGDITDVMDDNGNLDLKAARANGKSRLIKKIKSRAITTDNSDIVETEVEISDPLKAQELLGKYHALFTDKVDSHVSGEIEHNGTFQVKHIDYRQAIPTDPKPPDTEE